MAVYFTNGRIFKLSILLFCLLFYTVIIIPEINYKVVSKNVKSCTGIDISTIPREVLHVDDVQKYEKWKTMSLNFKRINGSILKSTGCIGNYTRRIAYDGVLDLTKKIDCKKMYQDPKLRPVVKFAVYKIYEKKYNWTDGYTKKNNSHNSKQQIMKMSKLQDCSLMEIIYTKDGSYPAMFSVVSPNESNTKLNTTLHWGFMYKFKMSLNYKAKILAEHSLTIVGKVNYDLHMYQHTYRYHKQEKYVNNSLKTQRKILNSVTSNQINISKNARNRNTTTKFSIMTFNIRNVLTVQQDDKNGNHYKNRMMHVAKVCQRANPDIISFQEIRFNHGVAGNWGPSQVNHLANLLRDYQYIYQPTEVYGYVFPERIEEGLAIFSKHPIVANEYILLSRDPKDGGDSHQRILLHAVVDIPYFRQVHVFNTHMSLSTKGRLRTVVQIWKHISKFKEPVFLMGDFNAEPNSEEIRYLSGALTLNGSKTSEFKDTWITTHGPKENGYTFSALNEKLSKRIDMIFMRLHKNVTVKSTEVVDDGQRNEHAASDHVPVLAKFEGHFNTS